MKKILSKLLIFCTLSYISICILIYFFQEKLIFFPQKLPQNYQFEFQGKFQEINIKTNDGKKINGVLFKKENSKGLIFYLHGNAGSILNWGKVAKTYNDLNYDIFILDYRSYGKSEGEINSQEQLFNDNQLVYNELKKLYSQEKIIILGYSIGTGMASKLASTNRPKLLILQAPYYNLTDLMKKKFTILPSFLLKYKFETNNYLKKCKMPIVIFHGDKDEVIYFESSLKLKKGFKPKDKLIILEGQNHNQITENEEYLIELKKILE